MRISTEAAYEIVHEMKAILGCDVNIMDETGTIIASTAPSRVGRRHPGACTLLEQAAALKHARQCFVEAWLFDEKADAAELSFRGKMLGIDTRAPWAVALLSAPGTNVSRSRRCRSRRNISKSRKRNFRTPALTSWRHRNASGRLDSTM